MRAKGLDKRASGSVIWVAPRDELAAKEKQELEAKKSMAELEALTTRSYRLNYLRADEAMAVVSGDSRSINANQEAATCSPSSTGIKADVAAAGAGGSNSSTTQRSDGTSSSTIYNVNRVLSQRGGASHDLTTNTLVVTDTLERHAAIEEVLKGVDVPSKQVMIEARIVVADDTFSRDLGAKLGFQGSGQSGNTGFGLGTYETSAVAATTGVTAAAPTPNVNLGVAGAPSLGFTIFNASTAAILSLELQALEVDNRGKIVSNPRVVTTNLRPAVILQGEQIPVVTPGTANAPATTTFKDALLCLLVNPQVLNNDSIILNVEVTKDARGAQVGDNVAINAKRIKTQVRVNNGETAVLGGIFEQTLRNDTDKVPFLGDLPVLGHLFKNNSKSDVKSEMLIFLTPRILQDDLLSPR
jgi:type IV pilus assembly protein PilQ